MMVFYVFLIYITRKFLRYQRRNQKPLIEGQTTHIQEKKRQTMIYKILHRNERLSYMKHTNKKNWNKLGCSRRMGSSCSTIGNKYK